MEGAPPVTCHAVDTTGDESDEGPQKKARVESASVAPQAVNLQLPWGLESTVGPMAAPQAAHCASTGATDQAATNGQHAPAQSEACSQMPPQALPTLPPSDAAPYFGAAGAPSWSSPIWRGESGAGAPTAAPATGAGCGSEPLSAPHAPQAKNAAPGS